jgi:putative membrane protein
VVCLLILPLFPILIIPNFFRYHTLRYRFDDEGVSMRWGILFRHEVSLNYARIQDIHLHSNLLERWLGLGRVLVQTASGSASAEMTIEGLLEFEQIRDFLYERMRGAKEKMQGADSRVDGQVIPAAQSPELAFVLRSVAAELRGLRDAIERQRSS